jgi:hypothetical protein
MGLISVFFLLAGLLGVTNIKRFALFGIALDQFERRKGFLLGEGSGTLKEPVFIHEQTDSAVGLVLALLAEKYPDQLGRHIGKLLLTTESENRQLLLMVQTTQSILSSIQVLAKAGAPPQILGPLWGAAETSLEPIVHYLDMFPSGRVKR